MLSNGKAHFEFTVHVIREQKKNTKKQTKQKQTNNNKNHQQNIHVRMHDSFNNNDNVWILCLLASGASLHLFHTDFFKLFFLDYTLKASILSL